MTPYMADMNRIAFNKIINFTVKDYDYDYGIGTTDQALLRSDL